MHNPADVRLLICAYQWNILSAVSAYDNRIFVEHTSRFSRDLREAGKVIMDLRNSKCVVKN